MGRCAGLFEKIEKLIDENRLLKVRVIELVAENRRLRQDIAAMREQQRQARDCPQRGADEFLGKKHSDWE